ncbi:hypothetical protein SAMN04488057_109156 [Cyclobacterium lianum]|uniref:MetA-pathway of phenol degradation n=1 Tax=Cyclobacterium lianum TaxID=388280 RepID=A0A1M7PM87_9BACT|nr:DUF6733 family protein [Cyclobacterium lianum]SHN18372.1 hypothetical protein SAMN04488057_109156 [Cyclobacterium lianum]
MRKFNIPTLLKSFIAISLFFVFAVSTASAQSETDDKFSYTITVNSDQFFGFYPFFAGSYAVSETSAFTFYGILWSGGTGGNQGSGGGWGNWTEFGVGYSFDAAEGLSINPQIGVTGGNLLSSGTAGPGVFGDGLVPNLTIGLDKAKTEGEIYFGLYTPLRDLAPADGTTLAYIHYWANFGVKASDFFSLGLHYEHLINSGGSNVAESTDVYQWFGPYIQFSDPNGMAFARLSAGGDLVEGNDSFFKVTTGLSF